ncbi:MAG: hypothetical protein JSS35_14785 [Proteobacteria bacterium]|nr:hypothetical protein [Pseudomonadota bacterium]
MSVHKFAALAASTALLGAAAGAHAATVPAAQPVGPATAATKPMDFTVQTETSAVSPGQTLKWDAAKGKWGVTFNLQQPETRSTTLNDIQAGAYYKITPSLRVGGAFSFGSQAVVPGPKPNTPDNTQPRVQLETKFKF